MEVCEFCKSQNEEMYVFMECKHFICLSCATNHINIATNSLKCCGLVTYLQNQSLHIINNRKNQKRQYLPNNQLNIHRVERIFQQPSKPTYLQQSRQTNNHYLTLRKAQPNETTNKLTSYQTPSFIFDNITKSPQRHRQSPQRHRPSPHRQSPQKPKFSLQKSSNEVKQKMRENIKSQQNQQNTKEILNQELNNLKKSHQQIRQFRQVEIEAILSLHIDRVRGQYNYIHKSLHHQQEETVRKLLQIYSTQLRQMQRPMTAGQLQTINKLLNNYINQLQITKNYQNWRDTSKDQQSIPLDLKKQGKGFRNQVLRKLDVNQAKMQDRISRHFLN